MVPVAAPEPGLDSDWALATEPELESDLAPEAESVSDSEPASDLRALASVRESAVRGLESARVRRPPADQTVVWSVQ